MSNKRTTLLALFLLVVSLAACNSQMGFGSASAVPQVPASTPEPAQTITLETLRQMSFMLEGEMVQLTDGRAEHPIVEDSAAMMQVVLLEETAAFGDLDGDGIEDATVVLTADMGGSGTFYYLAALPGGEPQSVTTMLLGDRIQVKQVAVESGEIAVEMVVAGPDDPMCCPTLETTARYTLQRDGTFVAAPSDVTQPSIVGTLWGWVQTTNEEGVFASNGPERYTLQLNGDGSYTAQLDCNPMSGTYTLAEDGTLAVTLGPSTRMACPEDSLDIAYASYLERATHVDLDGETLLITLDDGSVMHFALPE